MVRVVLLLLALPLLACSGSKDESAPPPAESLDEEAKDDEDLPPPFDAEPMTWLFQKGFSAPDAELDVALRAAEFAAFSQRDVDEEAVTRRTFTPPPLTHELAPVPTEHGRDPAATVPVGIVADGKLPPQEYRRLAIERDRSALEPGRDRCTRTVPQDKVDCWESEECDALAATETCTSDGPLGQWTATRTVEVRALVLQDGRYALIERDWLPSAAAPVSEGGSHPQQQYRLFVTLQDQGTPRRFALSWTEFAGDAPKSATQAAHLDATLSAQGAWLEETL